MTNDPNHTANAWNVARRIVPLMLEAGAGDEAWQSGSMDDAGWRYAVQEVVRREADPTAREFLPNPADRWTPKAGYTPSESTKRLIAEMIRAETAPTPTTDPFAGLPGVDD